MAKANEKFHSVGLGAMNLNGYLAKNCIAYDGRRSKRFRYVLSDELLYFRTFNANSKTKRTKLQESDYYNGSYFAKYIED